MTGNRGGRGRVKRVELRGGKRRGGSLARGEEGGVYRGGDVVGVGRGSGEARVWRRSFDLMLVGLLEE